MRTQIFQWTSQSEFGRDNGLTRNIEIQGRLQIESGSQIFYSGIITVPTALKFHFNPWL